jgi:hypothetical protein
MEAAAEEPVDDEPQEDVDSELATGEELAPEDLTTLERLARIDRPDPEDGSAPASRTPRPSLFGSRKPAADAARPAAGGLAKPADRVARPGEPVTRVRAPAPRPVEPPRPVAPAPEEFATSRPAMALPKAPVEAPPQRTERRERPRIAARAVAVAPAQTVPVAVSSADQEILDRAISLIVTRAAELAASIDPNDKVPVDMILEHCRETTERVQETLSGTRSAEVKRINADLGEVQDLIMLMQLEKGHAPADDAITLILQIRRDLETLRAA